MVIVTKLCFPLPDHAFKNKIIISPMCVYMGFNNVSVFCEHLYMLVIGMGMTAFASL